MQRAYHWMGWRPPPPTLIHRRHRAPSQCSPPSQPAHVPCAAQETRIKTTARSPIYDKQRMPVYLSKGQEGAGDQRGVCAVVLPRLLNTQLNLIHRHGPCAPCPADR
jgi:hypothetical protein